MNNGLPSRSMGLKLIVVCGLALFMAIPSFFVMGLVDERTKRAADVVQQISGMSGGQQTFLGPTLVIPSKIQPPAQLGLSKCDTYFVFPAQASAVVKTVTEERHRSLFKVPVYRADVQFDATFDLIGVPNAAPEGLDLDWNRAEMVVGISDARGALADATLTIGGATSVLVPAETRPNITLAGDSNAPIRLTLLGKRIDTVAQQNARFSITCSLKFSGAQRVAVLSYGKTTRLTAQGDWRNPGFDGGFLPVRRELTTHGFSAEWFVPYIARGVSAEGPIASLAGLPATALGTSFIEVADPYQSVSRSLKYVLLFLGLIFLTYFVFEISTGKRVHPAQYLLVGIAQIIFYLLLLSLSERIGFDWGFLLAGAATVALLSANTAWVFSRPSKGNVQPQALAPGLRAFATFTLLYAVIYLLLRMEDNALLVGAIASFLAVAATMYLTRRIDWYGSPAATKTRVQEDSPTAQKQES